MERKEGKWGGEGKEKLATARFKPRNNSQGACYVRWSTVFSFFSSSSSSSFFFLSLSFFFLIYGRNDSSSRREVNSRCLKGKK